MTTYVLPTLQVRKSTDGDLISCARCATPLTSTGKSWKPFSIVREVPTDDLTNEMVTGQPAETILRQFICRGCGSLLDTEIALPGEPFLEDILFS